MGANLEGEGEPGAGSANENEMGKLRHVIEEHPPEHRSGEKAIGV
jgi:hypothetical protein